MKLRYYLRGIGLGIVVAVLFCSVYLRNKIGSISDAEVIARAKKLGMQESTVLSNVNKEEPENPTENPVVDPIDNPIDNPVVDPIDDPIDNPVVDPIDDPIDNPVVDPIDDPIDNPVVDPIDDPMDNPVADPGDEKQDSSEKETVSITVNRGEGSLSVAKKLVKAGAIDNAKAFDRYLAQNKYDKKIRTGEHEVPLGADYYDVAKAICGGI